MESQYWTRKEQELYAQRMDDEHIRQNKRIELLEKNCEQLTELTLCVREQTLTISAMSNDIKEQGKQLKDRGAQLDKISNEQTITIGAISRELENQKKKINTQGEQINNIINEPTQQWQRVKNKTIDTIVGVVVGALITGIIVLVAQYIL